MKKFKKWWPVSILCMLIILIISNISFAKIINMPNDIYVSYDEIQQANKEGQFGDFVEVKLKGNELTTGGLKKEKGVVVFKLFGFIPIKKVNVNILPEEEVYVGGMTIGLNIKTDGAIIVSDTIINNENATIRKNKYLKNGDIIQKINDIKIESINDIANALENCCNDNASVKIKRNNKDLTIQMPLVKNEEDKYQLGIWVKDDCSGIGTLTFVKKDDKSFGALGHAVTNGKDENVVPMLDGDIYSSTLVNIEKGEKNQPGSLQCVYVERDKKGIISKNTAVGIYGKLDNIESLVDTNKTMYLGGRLSVKPGEAKLVSCVSGISEEYDIEIIKTNYQSKCSDKSFVFRVKDKRLLELTGGIVQGMSGSPIIQNGKVVGAVTHVFVSDATKGYAVYTDWMLQQLD